MKKHMRYFPIPEGELWRSPLLRYLIKAKHDISTLPGFSHAKVEDLLKYFCTSWMNNLKFGFLVGFSLGVQFLPQAIQSSTLTSHYSKLYQTNIKLQCVRNKVIIIIIKPLRLQLKVFPLGRVWQNEIYPEIFAQAMITWLYSGYPWTWHPV